MKEDAKNVKKEGKEEKNKSKGWIIGVVAGVLVVAAIVVTVVLVTGQPKKLKCAEEDATATYEFEFDKNGEVEKIHYSDKETDLDGTAEEVFAESVKILRKAIEEADEDSTYYGTKILADTDKKFSMKSAEGDVSTILLQGDELVYEMSIEKGSDSFDNMISELGGMTEEDIRNGAEDEGIVCE